MLAEQSQESIEKFTKQEGCPPKFAIMPSKTYIKCLKDGSLTAFAEQDIEVVELTEWYPTGDVIAFSHRPTMG